MHKVADFEKCPKRICYYNKYEKRGIHFKPVDVM